MAGTLFETRAALTQQEVIWVVGLVLGNVEYGALLMLSITCLALFFHSSRSGGWPKSDKVLAIHVVLVLLCNTFLQVWGAESTIKAIFYTDLDHITHFHRDWENIFIVILCMLTDGILVWRCYMVQNILCSGKFENRWHHIYWIFPIFLWLAEMGILATVFLEPTTPLFDESESRPGLTLFFVTLVINFTLNSFATSNIIIRLLLYRRSAIATFGRRDALVEHSLRISSILLESAAINLPLALLSIIGLLVHADYVTLLTQVITPGQSIASILVAYQVVRRRTVLENPQLVRDSANANKSDALAPGSNNP